MFALTGGSRTAVIDASTGATLSHDELAAIVHAKARLLEPQGLTFLFADNSVRSVTWLLAALTANHPVALLDPSLKSDLAERLIDIYQPNNIVHPLPGSLPTLAGQIVRSDGLVIAGPETHRLRSDLAILLTTSGSTGSPKFVQLSRTNIAANTAAIIESLGISENDRAITTLPLHYSYGMSVLLTHLSSGGSIVLNSASVMEAEFWQHLRKFEPTFLNGVPTTFQMLHRLRFHQMNTPSIRAMTQAGGGLSRNLIEAFHETMTNRNGSFFVMYGQTEASPRMTCLSPQNLPDKLGSVGKPLSGGRLTIFDESTGATLPAGAVGQVVYEGPNVMLGYASTLEDLRVQRAHSSVLRTGDLGYLDQDGFLFISGRIKRIAKVDGVRVGLDEIERLIDQYAEVAAVTSSSENIVVFFEAHSSESEQRLRERLTSMTGLPARALRFQQTSAIPRLPSGKPDYLALEHMANADES